MEEKTKTLGVTERTLPQSIGRYDMGPGRVLHWRMVDRFFACAGRDEKRGVAGFITIRYLGGTRQISQGPTRFHSTKVTVRINSYHPVGTLTVFHGLRL